MAATERQRLTIKTNQHTNTTLIMKSGTETHARTHRHHKKQKFAYDVEVQSATYQ